MRSNISTHNNIPLSKRIGTIITREIKIRPPSQPPPFPTAVRRKWGSTGLLRLRCPQGGGGHFLQEGMNQSELRVKPGLWMSRCSSVSKFTRNSRPPVAEDVSLISKCFPSGEKSTVLT